MTASPPRIAARTASPRSDNRQAAWGNRASTRPCGRPYGRSRALARTSRGCGRPPKSRLRPRAPTRMPLSRRIPSTTSRKPRWRAPVPCSGRTSTGRRPCRSIRHVVRPRPEAAIAAAERLPGHPSILDCINEADETEPIAVVTDNGGPEGLHRSRPVVRRAAALRPHPHKATVTGDDGPDAPGGALPDAVVARCRTATRRRIYDEHRLVRVRLDQHGRLVAWIASRRQGPTPLPACQTVDDGCRGSQVAEW
jgi:hypothetical protein